MRFKIHAERGSEDRKVFFYDNESNTLSDEAGFVFEYPEQKNKCSTPAKVFSKDSPLGKSRKVHVLKVQLGLSCNYACDYCSQKFVARPKDTTPKDIELFMSMLDNLEFSEQEGLKVEFWGGEPFVYWKTLKPLAEAIAERFAGWQTPPKFSVITNGSLLTEDICAWLYAMGFSVAISHDGPGQPVRGPDPLEDPQVRETILDFYRVMRPLNRISFNAMLNSKNMSRAAIHQWFIDLTGDPTVPLGEGSFVDAYDDDGVNNSLMTKADQFEFRRTAFLDILTTDGNIGFGTILQKIDGFTESVLSHRPASAVSQKCGMDKEDIIAVDLKGNVISCQNVSAVETAMNGQPHLCGSITDMDNVKLTTSTHWRNRPNCSGCPVVQICQGACMYLEGKYWDASCDNAYSDAIVLFAHSIRMITEGYIPYAIEAEGLPLERQDIWGTILEHQEKPRRKTIPIVEA